MTTRDQMQDVFPILFDFKKGEQPSSTKFTGWVKMEDTAFARITQAIGDTWDYQAHSAGGNPVLLSPQKLSITSLARMMGPSDWMSPQGGSWNESTSTTATLNANRNSWSLGFPLVKKIATITPTSKVSDSVEPCVWGTDITVFTDNDSVLVNRQTSPEDVNSTGDFYVDFYAGVITSFDTPSSDVVLTISTINMFGPGVPWGTANVIPTWDDGNLCFVTLESTVSGLSTYVIDLPQVKVGTRTSGATYGGVTPYDAGTAINADSVYSSACSGYNANYRMPHSITSAFSANNPIPEGYLLLWSNSEGRVIPSVSFSYRDEYSVFAHTPENWLEEGNTVRVIVPGTSVTEAVNWLMNSVRSNRHTGLTDGQDNKTLAYTSPISHDSLTDLFGGAIGTADVATYTFKKSSYPTNPHPQYLHRAGYMEDDATGNTGNAMFGNLVMAGTNRTLATDLTEESALLKFGGNGGSNASIGFIGGSASSTPLPFGIANVGIIKNSSTDRYGTVAFRAWRNQPFYLRSSSGATDAYNSGPSIGFDYKNNMEMNYIKLLPIDRTGSDDPVNMPAQLDGVGDPLFEQPLRLTPNLSYRINFNQLREFRFRGVPYLTGAENSGIQGSNDDYFTSPGVIGADFINVYSNAIFFSDAGDGKTTNLHTEGQAWLNSNSYHPAGIYYEPKTNNGGTYNLYSSNNVGNDSRKIASFSRNYTKIDSYFGQSGASTNCVFIMNGDVGVGVRAIDLYSVNGDVRIAANDEIELEADDAIVIDSPMIRSLQSTPLTIQAGESGTGVSGSIQDLTLFGRSIILNSNESINLGESGDEVEVNMHFKSLASSNSSWHVYNVPFENTDSNSEASGDVKYANVFNSAGQLVKALIIV